MERKRLTPRQVELLARCASGMTYDQVATECFISSKTVKTALYEARQRLIAKNNLQCLSVAISRKEININSNGVCYVPKRFDA